MSVPQDASARTGEWVGTHSPVLVAVDGSERNRAAVEWAAHEAAPGGETVLLTAVEEHTFPSPHLSVARQQDRAAAMLGAVREELERVLPDQVLTTRVAPGQATRVIVQHAEGTRMVVLGKRGLGGFSRTLVGSTSVAVAGRAPAPVVIVPDNWKQADHEGAPLVVGIDPYQPHHAQLHVAFSRAARLRLPLTVVHGWEPPSVHTWDSPALAAAAEGWEEQAHAQFASLLDVWRGRFPEVEVTAVPSHSHPAMAVLTAAEDAQLVVLGRHESSRFTGFAFGSVTRAVLHYAECPVMVVPTPG